MYKPQYQISNAILRNIASIEASKQIIENAPLIPSWERRFRKEAEERTIFFSVKLEGNSLDFAETKRIINGKDVQTVRRRDIQEILNYRKAVDYITKSKFKRVDKKLLLKVHSIVMDKLLPDSEKGEYRLCEEAVVSSKDYEIIHEPVSPEMVEGEIEGFFKWLANEDDAI